MSTTSFRVEIVAQKKIYDTVVHNAVFARDKIFTIAECSNNDAITILSLTEEEQQRENNSSSSDSDSDDNDIKMRHKLKEERCISTSSSGSYKTPLAANNFNIFTCDKENHVVAFSLEDDYKLVYKSSEAHVASVLGIDCHPTNLDEVATASDDCQCIIWNIRDDKQRLILNHKSCLSCVRYSTKGDRIAVATDEHGTKIYDTETGTLLGQIHPGKKENVYGVAWSQNDNWICACYHEDAVAIIETKNYTTVKEFAVNSCGNCAVFYGSNDNFCIVGTWGHSIHVIDMKTLELVSEEDLPSKSNFDIILELCVAPQNSYIRPTLTNVDPKFRHLLLVAQQGKKLSVLKLPTFGWSIRKWIFMMKEFSNKEKTRISLCLDVYNILYTTSKFLDVFPEN